MENKLAKRQSDGKLFEPSFPSGYDEGKALADCFSGKANWYFREIVELPKKFWWFAKRFRRTGVIWEPKSGDEFEVITERYVVKK